jgi:hypothetical protein
MGMNTTLKTCLALAIAGMSTLSIKESGLAEPSVFSEAPLNQSKVIAIASPYGNNKYNLLVLEQISSKKKCWSESGENPIVVDPLLLKFNFSGICGRATDSNGYSIRIAGEDYGLDVLLSVVSRDNELVLVGTNRKTGEQILVGRTKGISPGGFLKIQLDPGWYFTRRTFKGKKLGHFYFSRAETPTQPLSESSPVKTNKTTHE